MQQWYPTETLRKAAGLPACGEEARRVVGKGTAIRRRVGGSVEMLMADGCVAERDADGSWIVTNSCMRTELYCPLHCERNIDSLCRATHRHTRDGEPFEVAY